MNRRRATLAQRNGRETGGPHVAFEPTEDLPAPEDISTDRQRNRRGNGDADLFSWGRPPGHWIVSPR